MNTTPRIPRIVHVASGREWRGGQHQVVLLTGALSARSDLETQVVTGRGTELARRLAEAGVPLRETPWAAGIDPRVAMHAGLQLTGNTIVHAHDSHSFALIRLVARLRHVPIVVTRRVTFPVRSPRNYRHVAAVIAVSGAVATRMRDANVDPARIHIIPDAIDLHALNVPDPVAAGAISRESPVPLIVCIAALTPEKGIDLLIDAASQVRQRFPQARWLVLGDGEQRAALETRVTAMGLSQEVTFGGYTASPAAAMSRATLLVQPSREEGLGSSVLDALALGVPVVASRAGGLPEALAGGGGVLVRPEDAAALADAVIRLLDNARLRSRLSQEGRNAARRFGIDRVVGRTVEVYRSIMQTRGWE